ncbi:heme ABC exporter ATP-binding protein CcmA [Rhizobium sp. CRIBSB]|nr:heme ABC exporter ATP-binding protein CcmA [Rhizobium sp. CRIBSB]
MSSQDDILIDVSGLRLSRGERTLFRDLSFIVRGGEAVALTGANGAGKTSLLRAIAGFIRPDAGDITFGSIEASEARSHRLHLLGHLDGLKGARTAREEMTFQSQWLGPASDDDVRDGQTRAIKALGLEPLLDLETRKLSAGQRRRLSLARMIAAPRPIWLLDEPLSPLDAEWRNRVGDLMRKHLEGGGAILAAVHDPLPIPARALTLGRTT